MSVCAAFLVVDAGRRNRGRHETLNETNRDEVTRDLIAWLDGVVGRQVAYGMRPARFGRRDQF